MEVRSWIVYRNHIGLAGFVVLVASWFPGSVLVAQDFGHLWDEGPRRLPPVEPLQQDLDSTPDALGTLQAVSLSDAPDSTPDGLADAPLTTVSGEEGMDLLPIESQTPQTLDFVSDLAYELFGRPYNYEGSGAPTQSGWIAGAGDRMGVFTLGLAQRGWWRVGETRVQFNPAVHFVSGPRQTDLPAQLVDMDIGLVRRDQMMASRLALEVALRVGVFTDFEGRARDGVRFPGHAVLYYQLSENRQFVLGVDYLDRDDIAILPVVGMSFRPYRDLWIEAIFPKPRIALRLGSERWFYLAARMGGGMWAIERMRGDDDVVTYRDFQTLLGIQQDHLKGYTAFVEVGAVFGRQLEYRSGIGDYQPESTIIFRTVLRY